MANPVILFYNLDNEKGRKLKLICLKHKIKIKVVPKDDYDAAIGTLVGLTDIPAPIVESEAKNEDFTDEMMVFHNFDNQLLDNFLMEFRKNNIPRVNLKAVLTEHNMRWNSYALHKELAAEHEAMNTPPNKQ